MEYILIYLALIVAEEGVLTRKPIGEHKLHRWLSVWSGNGGQEIEHGVHLGKEQMGED